MTCLVNPLSVCGLGEFGNKFSHMNFSCLQKAPRSPNFPSNKWQIHSFRSELMGLNLKCDVLWATNHSGAAHSAVRTSLLWQKRWIWSCEKWKRLPNFTSTMLMKNVYSNHSKFRQKAIGIEPDMFKMRHCTTPPDINIDALPTMHFSVSVFGAAVLWFDACALTSVGYFWWRHPKFSPAVSSPLWISIISDNLFLSQGWEQSLNAL
jgi:hypothetical protein